VRTPNCENEKDRQVLNETKYKSVSTKKLISYLRQQKKSSIGCKTFCDIYCCAKRYTLKSHSASSHSLI